MNITSDLIVMLNPTERALAGIVGGLAQVTPVRELQLAIKELADMDSFWLMLEGVVTNLLASDVNINTRLENNE